MIEQVCGGRRRRLRLPGATPGMLSIAGTPWQPSGRADGAPALAARCGRRRRDRDRRATRRTARVRGAAVTPPKDVLVIARKALAGTGFALTPALARALAYRPNELVCPECAERCEISDIPEDQDPWCVCGTLMERAC